MQFQFFTFKFEKYLNKNKTVEDVSSGLRTIDGHSSTLSDVLQTQHSVDSVRTFLFVSSHVSPAVRNHVTSHTSCLRPWNERRL